MKHRTLLVTAVAGSVVLAAFASRALPLDPLRLEGSMIGVMKAEYREHDRDDHRRADNDCRGQGRGGDDHDDDHDDDDDGGAACGGRGAPMQQSANPPSNSLFTPGSKPRAQMN